jgi:N-acetylated-alpha-linked acidic dipeptidase
MNLLRPLKAWVAGGVLLSYVLSGDSFAQEKTLLGFSPASTAKQKQYELGVLETPSNERIDEYHRVMTSAPHHAGTPSNAEFADYYAGLLRDFGFDEVIMNRYEVLLPRPKIREVTLLGPEKYELKLAEPPLAVDPDTESPDVLPTYNAYAADGDVTGEVVYVNYGLPSDYEVLESLGVSVEGKIAVARYGRSWRGIKPRLAAEHGAIGCLIYSDPAEDGYVRGDVMPDGPWRPEHGVQRGSVMDMPTYPGDPQTPMRASKPGVERIPLDEIPTLQKIPVLPISYGDALPILRNLGGEAVPEDFRGGLPITYHAGPGPARLRIHLESDWSVRPIVNVIGILRGSEEPDKWIMAGGHRDAWNFGGQDPISGAASLLETARMIGEPAKQGQRPRRSIVIASWGAEEYGLIGSTEYGEEFADSLPGKVVVYLNRESYAAGDFGASGVHALQPFINEVVRDIEMPEGGSSVWDAWAEDVGEERLIPYRDGQNVRIGALGSGSDYTVFLDHLGIPSMNIGFSSENGIYHSRYDTRWFYTTYGDPGFAYGEKLSEMVARFLTRMANADVLPFDYTSTTETIDRYLDELETEAAGRDLSDRIDLDGLRKANASLGAAASVLNDEIARLLETEACNAEQNQTAIRRLNALLVEAERGFLHAEGLPGRPWYRHQIYAPGFYTGYGVKTLPGVREALEKGDDEEANEMTAVLEESLSRVRRTLLDAIVVAAGIGSD